MNKINTINPDQSFLKQLVAGDQKGMEYLFNKYYTFLVRFAIQIVNKEATAEDVVQEVFIKLWDKRETLEGIENIKAYLFRATKNSSLNWIKSSKNNGAELDINALSQLSKNDIEEQLAFEETQNKINIALNKIPEKCKAIFLLSREEGKSYKEIAQELNISIKTVENQMGKALKILRIELDATLFILLILSALN